MTSFIDRLFTRPDGEPTKAKPNRAQRRALAQSDASRTRRATRANIRKQRELDE